MGQVKVDEFELAKLRRIAKRISSPVPPKVRKETVVVVTVPYGDGSEESPSGYRDFYYRQDGVPIGELI